MMVGIQHIMLANESELFWDLSKVSVEDIENLVVGNELRLLEKQRQQRSFKDKRAGSFERQPLVQQDVPAPPSQYQQLRTRSKSPQAVEMERGPAPPQIISHQKKTKKVTVVEEPKQLERHVSPGQSSVAPQLSAGGAEELNQRADSLDKYIHLKDDAAQTLPAIETHVQTESRPSKQYAYGNRRHRKDFNRLKSSEAMGQLLKADDNVVNRMRTINNRLTSRGQPSQKSAQRTAYHQPRPATAGPSRDLPRSKSRLSSAPSHGRPSSRWRSGARSQDDLQAQEVVDQQRELDNKNKGMVYPSWWAGHDQIELDAMQRKIEQDETDDQNETVIASQVAEPSRAKVHKTLNRYAEDSLDARLRDVRQHAVQEPPSQGRQRIPEGPRTAVEASMRESVQTLDGRLENLQASRSSLPSVQSNMASSHATQQNPLAASSSVRQLANDQGHQMSRTHGSVGSFAYTSNRNVPKYSPMRQPNPSHANQPMTYSGPPNQEELQRDAMRHMSGNRNFQSDVANDSRQVSGAPSQQPSERQRRARKQKKKPGHDQSSKGQVDTGKIFKEMQAEAERNRRRVEGSPKEEEGASMNNDLDVKDGEYQQPAGGGLERRSRGGIALTVYPSAGGAEYPNQRASGVSQQDQMRASDARSDSRKRYPFADTEAFKGNRIPSRQRTGSRDARIEEDGAPLPRRVPAQYASVSSTIKQQVDYDKRQYMEKMRVQQMKEQEQQLSQPEVTTEPNRGASAGSRGSSGSPSKRAQIFYRRENEEQQQIMEYEEGRDDYYRGSEKQIKRAEAVHQAQTRSTLAGTVQPATTYGRQQMYPVSSSDNDARYYGGEEDASSFEIRNGAEAPKGRTISAERAAVMHNGDYQRYERTRPEGERRVMDGDSAGRAPQPPSGSDQAPSSQQPYRQQSSYANNNSQYPYPHTSDVNETGFTHKLARGAAGYNPSSISYSGGDRRQQYRQQQPPFMATGYYQNGRYMPQGPDPRQGQYYSSSSGQQRSSQPEGDSSQYDAQYGVRFSGEGENNTSRFGQRQPPQQYSSSTFEAHEQSSLATPNVSQGGRGILKNQFDQILMMKSGEFSAGGRDIPYRRGADGELLKSVGGSLGGIDEESINQSRSVLQYGRPPNGQAAWQVGSYQGYQNPGMFNGRPSEGQITHDQESNPSAAKRQPMPVSDPYRYDGGEDDRYQNQHNFNTSQFAQAEDRMSDPYRQQHRVSEGRYQPGPPDLERPGTGAFYQQQPQNEYKRANYYAGSTSLLPGPAGPVHTSDPNVGSSLANGTGNSFTLQRPSLDRGVPQPNPAAQQNNYYVDEMSAASKAGSPSRESPMRREYLHGPGLPPGEHMISSGTREYTRQHQFAGNAPPPHSKYYQTFNESRGGDPPRQPGEPGATSGSHKYGSTSQMRGGYGEEHLATSQLSPTHTSAALAEEARGPAQRAMASSHLVAGDRGEDFYGSQGDTRTENLVAFMEQAQPAEALMNSQGVSQLSSQLGLSNSALRRLHVPPNAAHQIAGTQHTASLVNPSSRTEEKEGGSIEDTSSMQITYDPAMISQHQRASSDMPQKKSAEQLKQYHAGAVAQPVGASIDHEDRMYRVHNEQEESSPEISQTEGTNESRKRKLLAQNHGYPRQHQIHDVGTADDDEFSDEEGEDFISSSLQETPAAEDGGTMTTSPLGNTGAQATGGKQMSEHYRLNREEGERVQSDIRKLTAQITRDVSGIGAAGQRLAGHLQDSNKGPQANFYRSTEDEDSSRLSETPKAGARQEASESEELSPLAKSDI